jgi:hypothetical protein
VTELITPVATWDASEPGWFDGPHEARSAWLKANGLGGMLYRIEFFGRPGDAPMARIFCYHLNAHGHRHWTESHVPGPHDHSQCDAARVPPQVVRLAVLPPEDLL